MLIKNLCILSIFGIHLNITNKSSKTIETLLLSFTKDLIKSKINIVGIFCSKSIDN